MIDVNHHGGVLKLRMLSVKTAEQQKILIMVIGMGLTMLVNIAAQDHMGKGISFGMGLPPAIDKGMLALGGSQCIHDHGQISGGWILHADRNLNSARRQSVLLILHRTGADSGSG